MGCAPKHSSMPGARCTYFVRAFCISKLERYDVLRLSSSGPGYDGNPAWRVLRGKSHGSFSDLCPKSLPGAGPSTKHARSQDAELKKIRAKQRFVQLQAIPHLVADTSAAPRLVVSTGVPSTLGV
jgi:hypothetical protein